MKRARNSKGQFSGGSATGGTGDIKPQFMTVNLPTGGGVDDYSIVSVTTPVITRTPGGFATVMEILSVHWYLGIADANDDDSLWFGFLSTTSNRVQNETSSLGSFIQDLSQPTVFAAYGLEQNFVTTGGETHVLPGIVNTNDGNGNGILVATPRFFVVQGSVAAASLSAGIVKILYRLVNIGLEEYIGIVAAQQLG